MPACPVASGTTSVAPQAGDWQTIFVYENAEVNLTHTNIRYGGSYNDGYYLALYNYGGTVRLDHAQIATSTVWGFYQAQSTASSTIVSSEFFTASTSIGIVGGTMSVSSTEIYNNDTQAIKLLEPGGTVTITSSHIHDNDIYGIFMEDGTLSVSSSVFNTNDDVDVYLDNGSVDPDPKI